MTITFNCLVGKWLITISLRFCFLFFVFLEFSLFFHLEHIPLFPHFAWLCICFYVLGKIALSPSFEGVALRRRWTLLFNFALDLYRLFSCLAVVSDLWGLEMRSPLANRAWQSRGIPWGEGSMWLLVLAGPRGKPWEWDTCLSPLSG